LSAVSVLNEAAMFGVSVSLDGDRIHLKAAAKPPASLLERLKANKAAIMDILRREADGGRTPVEAKPATPAAAKPATPAKPPMSQPPLATQAPPMSQAPLGISRRLAEALNHAAHYHVQFSIDESGLFVTQPPRDYKPAIQAAERGLMSCADEIRMICKLPERPKHFDDQAWVRAVADSARLGYRNWRED
jgi:hypothetical protein